MNAIIALSRHRDAYGEVFNIGHTKEISICELAVLAKKMTGSQSEIRLIPYEEAYEAGFEDMHKRLTNISKIQHIVGYGPTLDPGQMLERIIASQRSGPIMPRQPTT